MPPILLRVAWLDALDVDAQAQPPHRQLGESKERVGAGKGGSVIGANRPREPKVLKNTLKDRKSEHGLGSGECLAAQQVAAGKVGDGQRVAVASISEHELALIVR